MSSIKSVIVVAPGCPVGLIQELLGAGILPPHTEFDVLLPPENSQQYDLLINQETFSGRAQFFPSPARRFFSTRHLKWLQGNLRSSENPGVLIAKSPYQDLTSAKVSLVTMLLSGKTITLLRATPEAISANPESVIDLKGQNGQDLTENWLIIELNPEVLAKELGKIAWSSYPEFIKNLINYIERELQFYFETYDTVEPVNLKPLDSSTVALQNDLEHSLTIGDLYLDNLPGGGEFLRGKKVLEIGPGINFGAIMMLACHGAKVMVADRFLTPWDPEYHPKFYRLLKDSLAKRWPLIDQTPLDMILSRGKYPPEIISQYSCSLEELSCVPDHSVDLVISAAVLEHLYDLKPAFYHLARITKPGGFGLHTVDFRDHRDFSRPLEYLLLSDKEFSREFKERLGECGNRYRPQEMRQLLELMGFEVRKFQPSIFTEEEYLTEFLGRLRQSKKSRYRNYPAEDLRVSLGCLLLMKKHPEKSN